MKVSGLALALAATTSIAALAAPIQAQAQEQRRNFNIPAGSLKDALEIYTRQSGRAIVYRDDDVRGARSPGFQGPGSVDAVLEAILAGSGFSVRRGASGAVAVVKSGNGSGGDADPASLAREEARRAEVQAGSSDTATPEILVVGQNSTFNADIKRSENDTQPYVVFDSADIKESGATTIEEFLSNKLTASTDSARSAQRTNDITGNISNFGLRGLGGSEVVVLVDGRRLAGFGAFGESQQPDLNAIPVAMIERIEVLAATGSGIYGGGATAGVINIVLRRDFSGLQVSVRAGISSRGDAAEQQVSLSGGTALGDRTNVTFSASYTRADALRVGERDFARNGRARVLANDPAGVADLFIPPLGATPNIKSAFGTDLTLLDGRSLNSPITFVPIGYAGPGSDGGDALLANAGRFNLDLAPTAQQYGGAQSALLPETEIIYGSAALRHDFSDSVQAFLDLSYSENKSAQPYSGSLGSFYLPAGLGGNPFQEDIYVSVALPGINGENRTKITSARGTGGLIVNLGGDWRMNAEHTWHRTSLRNTQPSPIDMGVAFGAVASGQLNILRDPLGSFSQFAGPDSLLGPNRTTANISAIRISGSLPVKLPGGNISLSSLLERREEKLAAQTWHLGIGGGFTDIYFSPRSLRAESAYLEARLPLVSPENGVPLIHKLDLDLAGRADRFHLVGGNVTTAGPATATTRSKSLSSLNPTIALRYMPIEDLTLRASFAKGFLPPPLGQLTPNPPVQMSLAYLTDALRGNEPLGIVSVTSGGNADLGPEKSDSWSAGLIVTPRAVPGLRLSLDWTHISKRDNIGSFAATGFQPGLDAMVKFVPGRVTRGPVAPGDPFTVGPIIAIDDTAVNLANARYEAIDLSADYAFETRRIGRFELGAKATRLLTNTQTFIPEVGSFDFLGSGGNVLWRGTAELGWKLGKVSANWSTTYYDGYWLNPAKTVVAAQGGARVRNQTYHDLSLGLSLGATELTFGVHSIFDRKPPFDSNFGLLNSDFYSSLGDPRLRRFYLVVRRSF